MSEETDISTEEPSRTVTTSVQGRVLDGQRQPVEGAGVTGGGKNVITDANGNFLLENISVSDNAAVITVSKTGFFPGYRTLIVREHNLHYMQVELLLLGLNTYTGSTGDVVQFPEGTLTFLPSSLLTTDNAPYAGTVSVHATYIDPISSTIADQMPGDLRGTNLSNKQVGVRAFCMVALQAKTEDDRTLHIDSNKPVTFRIMIPGPMTADAPAEIPLWKYNPVSGRWTEEGKAQRLGNDYTGPITSAGFWMCGSPFPLVSLQVNLVTPAGAPLPDMQVSFLTQTGLIPMFCFTDSAGRVTTKVPKDLALLMTVTDHCNNIIPLQEAGPFRSATQMLPVIVTLPGSNNLIIEGLVRNCSDQPVGRGKVTVLVDGLKYTADIQQGVFTMTVPRCSNELTNATFTAVNSGTLEQTITTISVSSGTITPTLIICP